MATLFLGLGTNLGNKEQNLSDCIDAIAQTVGTVIMVSDFYETAPWGFTSNHSFLNAVVQVSTVKHPFEILILTQALEKKMGRVKKTINKQFSDRIIDIDILFYDHWIMNIKDQITVPHPLIQKRLFVLEPMSEIAPNWLHPLLNKTIIQLRQCLE